MIEMKKLYVVYLGGPAAPGRFIEDHEVVMVIADGQMGAMSKARTKWRGLGKAHVDRVMEVKAVDGFDITLVKSKLSKIDVLKECKNDYTK